MAIRPEELDEATEEDQKEIQVLEELINQELRKTPKEDKTKDAYTLTIRRGGKPEPNYFVKSKLRDIYLAAGWAEVQYKYKRVSVVDSYWEEFIVTLKRIA